MPSETLTVLPKLNYTAKIISMNSCTSHRRIPFTVIASLAALGIWILSILAHPTKENYLNNPKPLDLEIYKLAAQHLHEHGDIYQVTGYIDNLPFTYPPFSGFLFEKMYLLFGMGSTITIFWQVTSFFCLIGTLFLVAARSIRPGLTAGVFATVAAVASLGLAPVHETLFFGQINLFLLFLVSCDFLTSKRKWSGVGTGLAAGIKLTPALFGFVFVLEKRWIPALVSFLTFLVTVAIGWFTVPDAKDFWTEKIKDSSRVGDHHNPVAQSITSVLIRNDAEKWTTLLIVVVALSAAVAVWAALHRGHRTVAMSLAGLTACLVSPFTWEHHWIWAVPLCAVAILGITNYVADIAQSKPRWIIILSTEVAGLVAVALASLVTMPIYSGRVLNDYNLFIDVHDPSTATSPSFILFGIVAIMGYALTSPFEMIKAWKATKSRHARRENSITVHELLEKEN